jgi:hypothetical protein
MTFMPERKRATAGCAIFRLNSVPTSDFSRNWRKLFQKPDSDDPNCD